MTSICIWTAAIVLLLVITAGCGHWFGREEPGGDKMEQRLNTLEQENEALRQQVRALQGKTGTEEPTTPGVSPVSPSTAIPKPAPIRTRNYISPRVEELYNKGRTLLLRRDIEGAARIFRQILTESPEDKLAPNARYWLAECYYTRGHYKTAIEEFKKVMANYPTSHKASDATLKLAYCYHNLKDGPSAMIYLQYLVKRYPNSRAAKTVKSGKTIFKGI
jgi:tol-pal system protein YbgF